MKNRIKLLLFVVLALFTYVFVWLNLAFFGIIPRPEYPSGLEPSPVVFVLGWVLITVVVGIYLIKLVKK